MPTRPSASSAPQARRPLPGTPAPLATHGRTTRTTAASPTDVHRNAQAGRPARTNHALPRRHGQPACAKRTMPARAPRPCISPACPLPATHKGRCRAHHLAARKATDSRRPTAYQRGYDTFWSRTRAKYLAAHTRCECDDCLAYLDEYDRPLATDVDHRDGLGPLGPNGHDHHNLRAMAHGHHSRRTAQDQPGGFAAR